MGNKKVGILTFHRAYNHGAMLQCYALYRIIEELGHKPEIIDYRQPFIEKQYTYTNNITTVEELKKVLQNPRWLPGFIIKILPQRIRQIKRRWSLYKGITFSKKVLSPEHMPQDLNAIIIGSDQVWANYCTNGIDEMYYGNFPQKDTNIIGYAISSNIASLKEIGTEKLTKLCNNFKALSFREEEIGRYLREEMNIKNSIVIDPTLLLRKSEWTRLIDNMPRIISQDYILTFFLNYDFDITDVTKEVKKLSTDRNCKVINLPDVAGSPIDFLNLIRNAKQIITSSFHTIAFSIIFNKEFYAIKTNNGKDVRYINLLNKLSLQERCINYDELTSSTYTTIDYENIEAKLEKERSFSINYIKNNI